MVALQNRWTPSSKRTGWRTLWMTFRWIWPPAALTTPRTPALWDAGPWWSRCSETQSITGKSLESHWNCMVTHFICVYLVSSKKNSLMPVYECCYDVVCINLSEDTQAWGGGWLATMPAISWPDKLGPSHAQFASYCRGENLDMAQPTSESCNSINAIWMTSILLNQSKSYQRWRTTKMAVAL